VRLTDALARQLLYGAGRGPGRLTPERWLRSSVGGKQVAERAGRLAIGWLLRHGGAVPQTVWDAEGRPVATGPLWSPAVRAVGDWRFSASTASMLLSAASIEADEAPADSLHHAPCTPLDLVLAEALLAQVERRGIGVRSGWPEALRATHPLVALWRPAASPALPANLAIWLQADWLLPFLEAHSLRCWLAAEARRRHMDAAGHQALNQAFGSLFETLWATWDARGRVEHLSLFVRFYPRWLQLHGGVGGVLHLVRSIPLGTRAVSERERFEESFGTLLVPAMRLVDLARELRGYGWQRTPAEERFLGLYSREFEPLSDELRTLHDELWRIL